ncbi:hypothetical protein [Methylorubrum sp. SB2]|uniref:hypothetical protein n=1 Tax=Methylorubrum subtropicum TaxID=3138812 RepID=UPI00313EA4E9
MTDNLLTFRRPAPAPVVRTDVLTGPALRAEIEAAASAALDHADALIAILDRLDEEPDDEDGADAEPSLGAPEGHASQVVWLRGADCDLEL